MVAQLNTGKLHVTYTDLVDPEKLDIPRKYTLTHSDSTGELYLTIGIEYDFKQISGWYTRFMRDEVLAEWLLSNENFELHLYLHVSGGFTFGWASLRDKIFRFHLPMVLKAFRHGDDSIFQSNPNLNDSSIYVHFNSKNKKYNKIENYGQMKDCDY
jgi:hypothetical protein